MAGYKRIVQLDFAAAVAKVRDELKKQGFGIITEIDVKKTLKEKLNIDSDDYQILGACAPPYAHKALTAEPDVGLFMPCNVIIYRKDGKTIVAAQEPTKVMQLAGNLALAPIAEEVEQKLREAVDRV
ncbi:DUF302 domain-containing protein [Candidatus Woesearchaeota archaeon]|nr:DUF302 domain-containing protein [Candidatus Woesearchaeota archaeon]